MRDALKLDGGSEECGVDDAVLVDVVPPGEVGERFCDRGVPSAARERII
jgi:hypothetical protein